MTFDNLLFERDGAVAVITLNRPAVLNALSLALLTELEQAIALVEADASVRAVLITGAGHKAFAAGADIAELASFTPDGARAHSSFGQRLFSRIEHLGRPVVAAINGYALGGGCELALACTLRLGSDGAKLGQPEVNLGILTGFAGSQRLPRLIGASHALDLLMTGRTIGADEALRLGLLDRVTPLTELRSVALALAHELAAKPAHAIRAILEAVAAAMTLPAEQGQQLEAELFARTVNTLDAREGMTAFLEKRAPTFTES